MVLLPTEVGTGSAEARPTRSLSRVELRRQRVTVTNFATFELNVVEFPRYVAVIL